MPQNGETSPLVSHPTQSLNKPPLMTHSGTGGELGEMARLSARSHKLYGSAISTPTVSGVQAGDVLPPKTASSAPLNDVVVGTATPATSSSLATVTPATIGATGLGVHQTPGSDAATTIVSSTTMMDSPPAMSTSDSTTFPTPRSVEREQLIIQTLEKRKYQLLLEIGALVRLRKILIDPEFPEKNAVLPLTGSPSVQQIFKEAQRAIEAEAQSAGLTDPNAMGGHDKSHTTLASRAKTETPLLAAEIPVLPIASSEMPTLSTHQSQKSGVVVSTSVSSAESPAPGASMPQDASVDELSEDSKPLSFESDLPEGASKKAMLTDEDSKVLKGEVAAESAAPPVPAKESSSTSTADTTYSLDHVDFIARPLRSNLAVPPKFNVASEEVSVPTDEKEPLSAVDRPPAPKQAPGSARRPNARVLQTQESLNRLETMWKEHPARQKSLQAQQDANAVHEDKDTASNSAKPDDVPDLKPEVAVITQETALNESSQPAATRPSENETPAAATTNPEALTTSPEMPATTAEDSALFHVSPILENSGAAAKESRPPAYQTTSTTVTSMITISTPENEIVTNQSLTGSTTTWVKPAVSNQESAGIAEAPGSTSTIEPLPKPVSMIPPQFFDRNGQPSTEFDTSFISPLSRTQRRLFMSPDTVDSNESKSGSSAPAPAEDTQPQATVSTSQWLQSATARATEPQVAPLPPLSRSRVAPLAAQHDLLQRQLDTFRRKTQHPPREREPTALEPEQEEAPSQNICRRILFDEAVESELPSVSTKEPNPTSIVNEALSSAHEVSRQAAASQAKPSVAAPSVDSKAKGSLLLAESALDWALRVAQRASEVLNKHRHDSLPAERITGQNATSATSQVASSTDLPSARRPLEDQRLRRESLQRTNSARKLRQSTASVQAELPLHSTNLTDPQPSHVSPRIGRAGAAEQPSSARRRATPRLGKSPMPRHSTATTSGGIVEDAPHSFTSALAATLATRPSSSPSRDRNHIKPEPQAPTSGGSTLVTRGGDSHSLTSVYADQVPLRYPQSARLSTTTTTAASPPSSISSGPYSARLPTTSTYHTYHVYEPTHNSSSATTHLTRQQKQASILRENLEAFQGCSLQEIAEKGKNISISRMPTGLVTVSGAPKQPNSAVSSHSTSVHAHHGMPADSNESTTSTHLSGRSKHLSHTRLW